VIDNARFGRGTRVIDLATLLHYAHLYGYSPEVSARLEREAVAAADVAVLTLCSCHRMMTMLAWAIAHDEPPVLWHHIGVGLMFIDHLQSLSGP
jgi:hypothetical protein